MVQVQLMVQHFNAINGTAAAVVQAIADLDTDPTNFNSTLSAGAATAADIAAIEAANGTGTIDGSALTAINGTCAEITQALADLDADPTNFNSTLSAGAENATAITALEAANGTGTIDGSALTAINGSYAEIAQALTDLDTDPTNFDSTLSAGPENATDITALEAANGTGCIHGTALTAINGTIDQVMLGIAALDTDPTNFNSTLTGEATASLVSTLQKHNGNGTINGQALTAINGTYAEITQALADLDAVQGQFTKPVNNSTLSAGAENAADITALEAANGTGDIDGSALTEINGTYAQIAQALTDLDTDPTNFNSTLSAGAEDAADITTLEGVNGTGTIDGSALNAINGTAAAVVQAITDLDTDPTNFNSTLTGVAAATAITAIETANGTGTINGQALTAINGTYAEIVQALADLDAVENQFTKPVNFNSTLSEGAEDAANITTLKELMVLVQLTVQHLPLLTVLLQQLFKQLLI